MDASQFDPKGLIREAYRIEGITDKECRTIFLDWALSTGDPKNSAPLIRALLEIYGQDGHPMTAVLKEGLSATAEPARRGGWRGRRGATA